MELDLLHLDIVCDHQTVDLLFIVCPGLQVEPDAEDPICGIVAALIRNDRLPVADRHALIIGHVNRICTGLDLISDRLTLVEFQRKDQIGYLPALAEQLQLRVLNLDIVLVGRAQVFEGDDRHHQFLQLMPP